MKGMEKALVWRTARGRDGEGPGVEHSLWRGWDQVIPRSCRREQPSKQAAPQQLPGERCLGCPPRPCLPDVKLTEWMCREPGAAGWPRRGAS